MHMATEQAAALSITALSLEAVRELLEPHPAPCLSVYLPTHRNVPDNRVDRPSFRQLMGALEMSLSAAHRREEIDRLLRPFRLLADDQRFWEHTRDGLAVLASDGVARVFVLQRPVQPLALVTSRFHLLPLLRIAAALERFQLLALTSREARVFEGTTWHGAAGQPDASPTVDRLDPVPLPAAAGSVATEGRLVRDEVIDEEILQPHRVKLGKGPAGMAAGTVVHGGFRSKQDDIDNDTEIFLRHVDEVVLREVSQPSGLPLLLVAASRLAATFRGLSKNPLLVAEYVAKDPHLLTTDELAAAAADVFAEAREARIAREVTAFEKACDHGHASGDPADIARAAVAGRVATLFVDEADDLHGGVAETVLAKGGTIVALVRNAMPTETGLAAIYRY